MFLSSSDSPLAENTLWTWESPSSIRVGATVLRARTREQLIQIDRVGHPCLRNGHVSRDIVADVTVGDQRVGIRMFNDHWIVVGTPYNEDLAPVAP
jgi:hypothetical protein